MLVRAIFVKFKVDVLTGDLLINGLVHALYPDVQENVRVEPTLLQVHPHALVVVLAVLVGLRGQTNERMARVDVVAVVALQFLENV